MKRRLKRINKYTQTNNDYFIERLKRANQPPLMKIANNMAHLEKTDNSTKLINNISKLSMEDSASYDLKSLYNSIYNKEG
jgi:hypothetical protein